MSRSRLCDYGKLIELPVQKKLLSLLAGHHQGERAGNSHEFLDMAEYKIGDAISDIDWKTSARHNQPIIKRFESTAVLNVYLVMDAGANMSALASGAAEAVKQGQDLIKGTTKDEIAQEFATALSWMTVTKGDMLGLVVGHKDKIRTIPARSGLAHAEMILRMMKLPEPTGPDSDLLSLLRHTEICLQRRSLVLVVTDEQQITDSMVKTLKRMLSRHKVMVLMAEDYDPTLANSEMDSQQTMIADVRSGGVPPFIGEDPTIAYQWGIVRRHQQQQANKILQDLRIPFAVAGKPEQVLSALQKMTEGGKRGPVFA